MPPRKRSMPEFLNSSKPSNKRENDTPLPDSGKRRKHADVNNKELRKDSYCWICHQFGHDVECKKEKCQRVYHNVCLDKQFKFIDGVCPECQQLKSKNKFLTVDNLRDILGVAVEEFRKKFKSPDKMMFFQWPNIESRELVRIIDLDFLEDSIKDTQNPYKSLAGFLSDVKWIHHNYCILDGVDSSTAKEAEGFVRTFQKEIFDIEDCPMCYYNMLVAKEGRGENFFLKICDPPHDIVWAKLKGSPHWPAKCLRVVNGKAHVRFFFTHDKSNIPLDKKKCLSLSMNHPEHKSSRITDTNLIPKKMEYKEAVEELLDYVKIYEKKFNKTMKFYPVGTPYKYEAPKPIRKKRKKDSRNTLVLQNSEQNMQISPSPSVDHLNSSRDITENIEDNSVNCPEIDANHSIDQAEESSRVLNEQTEGNQSIAIEESAEQSTNRTEFVAINSSQYKRANMIDASTSPVLSASMICEVAGSSDAQASYIHPLPNQVDFSHLNLSTGASVVTSTLQPLISYTSTPVSTNNNKSWKKAVTCANTPNTAAAEGALSNYSESQRIVTDAEILVTDSDENESIPLYIGPSTSAKNPKEDDDVVYIRSSRRSPESALNPTNILQHIFNSSPDLQTLFKDGRFVFDSLFVRCWAFANRCPQAPEIIASLIVQMKKLHADKIKLLQDKRALSQNRRLDEGRVYREEMLQENNNKLRTQLQDMTIEIEDLKAENSAVLENARFLLDSLHKQYLQTLDITVKQAMRERDEALQERNDKIKEMYQQNSHLKQNVHELGCKYSDAVNKYNSKLEDMLKVQEEKEKISQETIQELKNLIGQYFHEIKHALKPETSSSGNHEGNVPLISSDEQDSGVQKSVRRSPTKTERCYQKLPIEAEATAQYYQKQEIQTVARKTSVSVQLERTMKTTTTTRNEGKVFGYNAPIYGSPFDPSTSAGHPPFNMPRLPPHDIHPSSLLPPNLHARESHAKEARRRQSRFND